MEGVTVIQQVDNETAQIVLSISNDISEKNKKNLNSDSLHKYDGTLSDDNCSKLSNDNKHLPKLTDKKPNVLKEQNSSEDQRRYSEPPVLSVGPSPNSDQTFPSSSSYTSGFYSDQSTHMLFGFHKPKSESSGSNKSAASSNSTDTRGSSNDSWTDCSMLDKDDDAIINAELGLAEDHFSRPDQGHFCLTTMEELEMAIENCKELILEAPEKSEKRKNLVKKLIQLRMKLQELKEGPEIVHPLMKVVLGHHFVKKQSQKHKHYCEKCSGIIWGMIQVWHQCIDCGFSCHGKCLNLITRTCANVKVKENPTFILDVCPEVGLSAQNYRCAECRTHIMFKNSLVEPRQCDYNGLYYCPNCHWNSTAIIPARVLHNWDFETRKVCRASKQFLRLMRKKAVLRIQDINPMLFGFVEELSLVKKLREEILIMKKYFLGCKDALENKILLLLSERQHFVENSDYYSMQDLSDIQSGTLIEYLTRVHSTFVQHIKSECKICQGQGYICELCKLDEVLFPFDHSAAVCPQCSWVFHKECFMKKDRQCTKCLRKQQRALSKASSTL